MLESSLFPPPCSSDAMTSARCTEAFKVSSAVMASPSAHCMTASANRPNALVCSELISDGEPVFARDDMRQAQANFALDMLNLNQPEFSLSRYRYRP
jgi:hypothetical protein